MLVWVDPPDESSDENAFSDVISRAKAVLAHSLKALRKEANEAGRSFNIAQGDDAVYVSRRLGHANVSITAKVYLYQIEK